jgi:two-component system chemotaxis response regulator CheY
VGNAHSKTCLVVDDSRVVRKVARRIAEELGFECTEAEDGQKAYDACRQSMPDAILLDWNMPVMDGMEFLAKLREMKNGKHPKVIFCTIESKPKNIQKALKAGANEYIVKPFDSEIIKAKFTVAGLIPKE